MTDAAEFWFWREVVRGGAALLLVALIGLLVACMFAWDAFTAWKRQRRARWSRRGGGL